MVTVGWALARRVSEINLIRYAQCQNWKANQFKSLWEQDDE